MQRPKCNAGLLFLASTILWLPIPALAQSLRGIDRINQSNLRLPALTITSVTLETTADLGLVETTTGLERQRVEIPTSSGGKTVIETYAGTAVQSVTLFDPRTYSNQNPGTTVGAQGPAEGYPYICGAAAPGQAANVPGTYETPFVDGSGNPILVATGPGEPPKNYYGDNQDEAAFFGTPDPNPLSATVVSAGTAFARQPWLSSGAFGNGIPNTAPLQITPFPAGVPYPDCGG